METIACASPQRADRPWLHRSPSAGHGQPRSGLLLVLGVCLCFVGICHGTDEDFAELYSGNYTPPPDDLALQPPGQARSESLALYYKGIQLESRDKLDSAIACYQDVLNQDPGFLSLAEHTAILLSRLNRKGEAFAILEKSLEDNPREPEIYLALSQFYATYHGGERDTAERAIAIAEQAVQKFPHRSETYRQLINLYLVDAEREQAALVMTKALAQEEVAPHFWISIGKLAQRVWPFRSGDNRQENIATVSKIYERAIREAEIAGAKSLSVVEKAGDFFAQTRQHGRAIEIYQKVADDRPDDLDAREKLARVLRLEHRHEEALDAFEQLVSINPYDSRIHQALYEYYVEQKKPAAAATHLLEAIKLGRNSTEHFIVAAQLLINSQQVEEAFNVLRRATFLYPDDPRFPLFLAGIYAKTLKQPEKALEYYARTESLYQQTLPGSPNQDILADFYFDYAATSERAKDFERAAELFKKTIELLPEDAPELGAQAYNYLGYMWIEQETNIDEAGELIKYANELVPDNGAYTDSLGWFYYLKGDYEKALAELLRAEKLIREEFQLQLDDLVNRGMNVNDPRFPTGDGLDPVVLDHIAQTYIKLGKTAEATSYLQRALELEGATDDMRSRLQELTSDTSSKNPTE